MNEAYLKHIHQLRVYAHALQSALPALETAGTTISDRSELKAAVKEIEQKYGLASF